MQGIPEHQTYWSRPLQSVGGWLLRQMMCLFFRQNATSLKEADRSRFLYQQRTTLQYLWEGKVDEGDVGKTFVAVDH